MTTPAISTQSLFTATVEDALKNYTKPEWLGEHSPLASPYLLTNRLSATDISALIRGETLQNLLTDSLDTIQGDNADRYRTILRGYYFDGGTVAQVGKTVGLAKNSFHLNRKAAIDALADVLISQLHPALRLESPPATTLLLERDEIVAQCLTQIEHRQTIAITGGSGIGKTALAARLVADIDRTVFWYTIRPSLTDQLESLLFAIGLFAHEQGSSTLWQELIATDGEVAAEKAISMVRFALESITPTPLLCFDDLDLLQPRVESHHQQLLTFLEQLRGLAPQLLIGQRVTIEADNYLQLSAMSLAGTRQLLLEHSTGANRVRPTQSQLSSYHKQTQGNPRLLGLCRSLLQLGESAEDVDTLLLRSPSVEALLSRILARSTDTERGLLAALSVYPSPAPAYIWHSSQTGPSLNNLVQAQLVQQDETGGVEVVPIFRTHIYQNLTDTVRQQLHANAARMRQTMGAYTAAAFHYVKSGQINQAVWGWRSVQNQEVEQGQAQAARALFRPLLQTELEPQTKEVLTLICSQLERFTGNLSQAAEDLQATLIQTPILQIEAAELAGIIGNDQSDFAQAEEIMRQSLRTADALVESRIARIRKGLGWLHMRQRDFDMANHELALAQYEIDNLRGNIAFNRCEYEKAEHHYRQAHRLAEETQYREGVAKTATNLGNVYLFRGQFEECKATLEQAYAIYREIGKTQAMAGSQLTLAVAHNQADDHRQALVLLGQASKLTAQSESVDYVQALITHARAESHLGLGQLDEAETEIQTVIDFEELDILPDAYRVYGEILTQRGDFDAAQQALKHGLSLAEEYDDPYLCGYIWRALGILYQTQDKKEDARNAFDQAIDAFTEINLPNEVEKTSSLLAI